MMANNMHFAWIVHLGRDSWPLLYIYASGDEVSKD